MNAKKLTKAELFEQISALIGRFTVIAPKRSGTVVDYLPISAPEEIVWDVLPYKSPKETVFARVEKLLRFDETGVSSIQELRPVLLFGARPCDLEAFCVLDEVFVTGEKAKFADPFYAERRKLLTIVGLACEGSEKGCFCSRRGIDRSFSEHCDAFVTPSDVGYIVEKDDSGIFAGTPCDAPVRAPKPEQTLKITAPESELFDTMPWPEYAAGCLGCGTCTYICPTCHCFNFTDGESGGAIERSRVWDSCMYPNFTLHAGGHNPRTKRWERFRQRVMHKYVYIRDNLGKTACTGCGRCLRACPGGLNIRAAVEDIQARSGGEGL